MQHNHLKVSFKLQNPTASPSSYIGMHWLRNSRQTPKLKNRNLANSQRWYRPLCLFYFSCYAMAHFVPEEPIDFHCMNEYHCSKVMQPFITPSWNIQLGENWCNATGNRWCAWLKWPVNHRKLAYHFQHARSTLYQFPEAKFLNTVSFQWYKRDITSKRQAL